MYTSKWITSPDARYSETKLYWFRRTLTLPATPEKAVLHISAEARYKLFVDGKRVCFGPCRTSAEERQGPNAALCPLMNSLYRASAEMCRMAFSGTSGSVRVRRNQ